MRADCDRLNELQKCFECQSDVNERGKRAVIVMMIVMTKMIMAVVMMVEGEKEKVLGA
jgi:predicted nucleic acid-binding Zn ribbon protein